jgi:hypothetical protein
VPGLKKILAAFGGVDTIQVFSDSEREQTKNTSSG